MGQIVGGILAIFVLHAVWEFLLFKRICDDPVKGKLLATAAAYATAVVVYGFGAADGGPWTPAGIIAYLPGAVAVAIYSIVRGRKVRQQSVESSHESTFS